MPPEDVPRLVAVDITCDPAPSRGWCPIANAAPLCVSRTQSRPLAIERMLPSTLIVRRRAPVDESHTLQMPSLLPEAILVPSTWIRVSGLGLRDSDFGIRV